MVIGEGRHGHEPAEAQSDHGVDSFCEVWYGGEVAAELIGISCGVDLDEYADCAVLFERHFLNFFCESEGVDGMDEVNEVGDFFDFISLEVADHVPSYLIGYGNRA